ncbi:MAG: GNAT family N-acetyltransferase [Chitinophagaceae bacterium]
MIKEAIAITRIGLPELNELLTLARQTFVDSFGPLNSEENMRMYMEKAFTEGRMELELKNPESLFFFAKAGEQAIGYLKIKVGKAQTELRDEQAMEVERIYVSAQWQGRKVGQMLMDKAIELAAEGGFRYLWLGVFEANTKAIAFYKRNGFVEFDQHLFILGTDEQRDIMMRREMFLTA